MRIIRVAGSGEALWIHRLGAGRESMRIIRIKGTSLRQHSGSIGSGKGNPLESLGSWVSVLGALCMRRLGVVSAHRIGGLCLGVVSKSCI